MKKGIIASGIWCVDISYKIKNWPSEGKTSIVERKIVVLADISCISF